MHTDVFPKPNWPTDYFVRAEASLRPPVNAVAALLVLDDGRYVMQLRDALPHIFYPNHWGCFGGEVEAGELPLEALRRELREELEFEMQAASEFTRFEFDLRLMGHGKVSRSFFEIAVPLETFQRFVLHEGADFQALSGAELLATRQVTPYDAFALWLHLSRHRLGAAES